MDLQTTEWDEGAVDIAFSHRPLYSYHSLSEYRYVHIDLRIFIHYRLFSVLWLSLFRIRRNIVLENIKMWCSWTETVYFLFWFTIFEELYNVHSVNWRGDQIHLKIAGSTKYNGTMHMFEPKCKQYILNFIYVLFLAFDLLLMYGYFIWFSTAGGVSPKRTVLDFFFFFALFVW